MSSRAPSSSVSSPWQHALRIATRLSRPESSCIWLRRSFLDTRPSHWDLSLRMFETALLSGASVDRETFHDASHSTCQCGDCKARRRCTGVALLCASETSERLSRLGSVCPVLRRERGKSSDLAVASASSSSSSSSSSSLDDSNAIWTRLVEKWRQMEIRSLSAPSSASSSSISVIEVLQLIRQTSATVLAQVQQQQQQQQHQQSQSSSSFIIVDELSAYAPHFSRFALWANAWRLGADRNVHVPVSEVEMKMPGPTSSSSTIPRLEWIPDATMHLEASVEQLARRAHAMTLGGSKNKKKNNITTTSSSGTTTAAAPRLIIPTAAVLQHSRGLTSVAEASRNGVVVISPTVLGEAVLQNHPHDKSTEGVAAAAAAAAAALPSHLRQLLKIFFPQNSASPPKRVLALPVVDELRMLDAISSEFQHLRTEMKKNDTFDEGVSVSVLLASSMRLLTCPRLLNAFQLAMRRQREKRKGDDDESQNPRKQEQPQQQVDFFDDFMITPEGKESDRDLLVSGVSVLATPSEAKLLKSSPKLSCLISYSEVEIQTI